MGRGKHGADPGTPSALWGKTLGATPQGKRWEGDARSVSPSMAPSRYVARIPARMSRVLGATVLDVGPELTLA
jgi:hypothetical protein